MRLVRFFALSVCLLCGGALVAAGSGNVNPYQEYADLITTVHDTSAPDYRMSGPRCATCHGNIFSLVYVQLKTLSAGSSGINIELKKNHHRLHENNPAVAFGEDCTFCHAQFEVRQDDAGRVVVSSYVDKVTCAACHSTFTPTGRMDESYIGDGCPGCHGDPGADGSWNAWHYDPTYSPDMVRRFVDTAHIPFGTDYCLDCHGFNKYLVDETTQGAWWAMTMEERDALISTRGQPWSWELPSTDGPGGGD